MYLHRLPANTIVVVVQLEARRLTERLKVTDVVEGAVACLVAEE
jgi:hypothetical protein